jgi:hypothetical protein
MIQKAIKLKSVENNLKIIQIFKTIDFQGKSLIIKTE